MRRKPVLFVVGAIVLIGIGAYAGLWWFVAGRIKDAVAGLPDRARAQKLDVAWDSVRIGGFPFAFRIELSAATMHRNDGRPGATLRAPALSASAHPWSFRIWRLAAPDGITATFGPAETPLAALAAAGASGTVAIAKDGETTVWLGLDRLKIAALGGEIAAGAAQVWVLRPQRSAEGQDDAGLGLAVDLHDLAVPETPPGFAKTISDLGLGVTVTGRLQSGPLRETVAAWRDSGGTLELDQLQLHWGELGITASGTLALNADLQPVGGFSGAIAGYDQLMSALVAAGRVKASDARVARLALAILAKAGPDGRPEIATSFRIQNGEMFLGPAKLGKAPQIDWQ